METTTPNKIDCLKLKAQVQAELQKRVAELTPEEELAFHRTYPLGEDLRLLVDRIRAAHPQRTRAA